MTICHRRKQRARFLLRVLVLIGAVAAFAALGLSSGPEVGAQASQMLGVDVRPNGNGAVGVGQVDGCQSVDAGEEFLVDIVVTNVDQLTAWELRVQYDASVLALQDADYDYFLLSAPGGRVSPSLFESEANNRYFLAAADYRGTADSGSGTLARLRFRAIAEGTSPVLIVDSPRVFGPQLIGTGGAIGDSSGDGIWDGLIVDANVNVGGVCDENPIVTPAPTTDPAPQSGTEPGPTTNGGSGDAVLGSSSEPGSTGGPVVIADPDVNTGDADEEPASNEPGGEGGSNGNESGANDDDSDDDSDDGRSLASGESSGGFPWIVVALASLGALMATSGLFVYSRSRKG